MSGEYFDFKQFRVYHGNTTMKVGTDAVLLGAMVPMKSGNISILDIGTGSGLIALILAQRHTLAQITAIEIDEAAATDAARNFDNSPWSDRLRLYVMPFQQFAVGNKQAFDVLVSNPPYFESGSSYGQHNLQRKRARYNEELPWQDLLQGAAQCLATSGEFWLILPCAEASIFTEMANINGWYLKHALTIYGKASKPAVRSLICLVRTIEVSTQSSLILYEENGKPTQAYIAATQELYLRIGT